MALLVISCDALAAPLAGPGWTDTAAAATDNAAFTQTAAVTPPAATVTLPPQPTSTLSLAPTVSTAPFMSPTAEVLDCKLLWQSPHNGTHYDPREAINMGWSVTNTGTVDWDPGSVSFVYVRGTRMQREDLVSLPSSVAAGDSVVLTAPLRSPKVDGTYSTVWSLRRGQDYFCAVSLSIIVP